MIKGIDISEHQGANFDVKGNDFVIIRASWGHFSEDKYFKQNAAKCNEAGIPWGAYHYSYARSYEEAKQEAQQFLNLVRTQSGRKYPLVVDIEDADHWKAGQGVTMATEIQVIKAWKEVIEGAGEYLMLYCNLSYYNQLMSLNEDLISSLDLWLAQWGVDSPSVGYAGMWQYQGYPLDSNIACKDYPSIIKPKEVVQSTTPKKETHRYKEHDKVIVSSYYASSTDGSDKATVPSEWVEGEITKVLDGVRNPYLLNNGNLGWCNDGDIRGYASQSKTYTVQSGDTLSGIASKFGTTYQKIANDNGITDPNKIYPGQVLTIK